MVRTEEGVTVSSEQVLANLLFGAYRHRVLSLLFLRPGDGFHVRMISRLTGVPAGSLHRELRQLADAGLLSAERIGNQIHYSANEASPVFDELAAVLEKTAGAPPTLDDHSAEHSIEPPPRPKSKTKSRRKASLRARPARR
jgi:DNA-binding transcriptional ArsR family regulator